MKKVGVAILGLGAIGGGTYRILTEHAEFYRRTQEVDITVESVLEPDCGRARELGVPEEKIASSIAEVVSNADVDIVAEIIGDADKAREYVLAALSAGKTVVTSNKELFSKYSHELERVAKRHNAGLYFEACCAGGVPVVRTLLDSVQSNEISAVMGVVTGASNYILTRMTESGSSYEDALKEAQRLGYAGADPSADVEGFNAAYTLSILCSLAFHTKVPFSKVFREGIAGVAREDIDCGAALGYRMKLLAVGKRTHAGVEVRVHPAFVKEGRPLAAADGAFDTVLISGDSVGDIMLYGKGSGALPMGSAIVSDIIFASTHAENKYSTFKNSAADKEVKFVSDFSSAYYLRLAVTDRAGALAKIAAQFAKHNISIEKLIQKDRGGDRATLVLVTHETHELAVKNAAEHINASGIAEVQSVLRVAE